MKKPHQNLFLKNVNPLFTEYEIDLLELVKSKKAIKDKIPVQERLDILKILYSNLHNLEILTRKIGGYVYFTDV